MDQADGVVAERRVRKWRSGAEKRRIVELTLQPGASIALVARAHGVNANQVYKWRRDFERGALAGPSAASTGLLPVTLSAERETAQLSGVYERAAGSIHIEFPGRGLLSIESGADPTLLRVILESLRR
jgi:transposase